MRHFVGQIGRRGAGPAAVEEAERLVESYIGDEIHRRHEIVIGLTRKSDDDVGRYADVGPDRPKSAQLLLVLEYGMSTLHGGEDAVGTALHRQMQEIIELRYVGIRFDQTIIEVERMRSRESDAFPPVDGSDKVDQCRKGGERSVLHGARVRVHVLP